MKWDLKGKAIALLEPYLDEEEGIMTLSMMPIRIMMTCFDWMELLHDDKLIFQG
jgi:hypothetical protein